MKWKKSVRPPNLVEVIRGVQVQRSGFINGQPSSLFAATFWACIEAP